MKPLTVEHELVQKLAGQDGSDLISIFMPTHEKGPEIDQDRIRLKNAISGVDDRLEQYGWKPQERSQRVNVLEGLLDDAEFWQHQGRGLACFVGPDETTPLAIHRPIGQQEFVLDRFVVRHLYAQLDDSPAMVLVLTQNEVRLYSATKTQITETEVDLPDFADVNWFVDRESQRQQHPDRAGSQRNRHGHTPESRQHEDLNRFLREVAKAIPESAIPESRSHQPLVVLGDDDLVARFDEVTDIPLISPDNSGISGALDQNRVHGMVVPLIEHRAQLDEAAALERAEEHMGRGEATTVLGDALADAMSGRFSELIYWQEAPTVYGQFDESALETSVHPEPARGDVDLMDRLVVMAAESGAALRPVSQPVGEAGFVAVRRF